MSLPPGPDLAASVPLASGDQVSGLALLAVFVGSGAGGLLRYAVGLASRRALSGVGPAWSASAGTLFVNVVGSATLMLLLAFAERRGGFSSDTVRLLWTTGAMGGFTTYSAFNAEVLAHWSAGRHGAAGVYLMLTVIGCAAGGWLGARCGGWLGAD